MRPGFGAKRREIAAGHAFCAECDYPTRTFLLTTCDCCSRRVCMNCTFKASHKPRSSRCKACVKTNGRPPEPEV
jgi:hypothetical protein